MWMDGELWQALSAHRARAEAVSSTRGPQVSHRLRIQVRAARSSTAPLLWVPPPQHPALPFAAPDHTRHVGCYGVHRALDWSWTSGEQWSSRRTLPRQAAAAGRMGSKTGGGCSSWKDRMSWMSLLIPAFPPGRTDPWGGFQSPREYLSELARTLGKIPLLDSLLILLTGPKGHRDPQVAETRRVATRAWQPRPEDRPSSAMSTLSLSAMASSPSIYVPRLCGPWPLFHTWLVRPAPCPLLLVGLHREPALEQGPCR